MTAGVATRGNWTPERIETMKRLHERGDSYGQIALQLGGVSRNAVCGKLDRLSLKRERIAAPGAARVRNFCIPKASRAKAERSARPRLAPIPDKDTRRKLVLAASEAGIAAPTFRPAKTVPTDIALNPRHWITRGSRECAWPHDGEGYDTRSCCNKTLEGPYCPGHTKWAYNEPQRPALVSDAGRFDGRVLHGRKVAAA